MQIDINQQGPWFGVEPQEIRAKFLEFNIRNYFPENFLGVAINAEPYVNRDFSLVFKGISVDKANRPEGNIPCNLCGHPKFLHDGILIVDEMGWLYMIGPICGRKHFEDRFVQKERLYEHEQKTRLAEAYLFEASSNVERHYARASSIKSQAVEAQKMHDKIKRSGNAFKYLRRFAVKEGGWLKLEVKEKRVSTDFETRHQYNFVNFRRLRGLGAMIDTCNIEKDYDVAMKIINGFGRNENEALSAMAEAEDEGKIVDLADNLRHAKSKIDEIENTIREFLKFLSEENFQRLKDWSTRHNCPVEMVVEFNSSTRTIYCPRSHRRFHFDITKISMGPMFEAAEVSSNVLRNVA